MLLFGLLTPHTLTSLLYGTTSLVIVVVSFVLLFKPANHTRGLVTVQFPTLQSREISFPDSFDSFASLAEGATSLLNFGTVIESAAAQATSAVMDALGSAESLLNNSLPNNVTVGTTHVCVGYATHSQCGSLPLNDSTSLLEFPLPISPVALFTSIFEYIPPVQTFLIVATAFLFLSILIGVGFLTVLKSRWVLLLLVASSFLSFLFFLVSTFYAAILYAVSSLVSGIAGVIVERGEVLSLSIVAVVFGLAALLLGLVRIIL
ncbi:hypothetical protein F4821DRAFT_252403 [Hypoxylon rubiginosum]|uniref:Uncharacterized protein n=1 Tax=Hypoxylon rubiginosum TaxID=110542 RepID=A0ACC0CI07_9PEZI|nr:hypothetical protein F4821DRAFT_252403 [Hypoxylon rubiginosum]